MHQDIPRSCCSAFFFPPFHHTALVLVVSRTLGSLEKLPSGTRKDNTVSSGFFPPFRQIVPTYRVAKIKNHSRFKLSLLRK